MLKYVREILRITDLARRADPTNSINSIHINVLVPKPNLKYFRQFVAGAFVFTKQTVAIRYRKKMDHVRSSLKAKIIAAGKNQDIFDEFKTLSTDEESIIFTLNIMLEYGIVPKVCGDTKDANVSQQFRNQGNKVFGSTELSSSACMEALKLYTQSIAFAPSRSEKLALAYANRSAVLIKLRKYEECIRDIDRALALMYPDNLKAKVYIRKAECLKALKQPAAEDAIKEAQQWLEKMNLDNGTRKKFNDKLISIGNMPCSNSLKSSPVITPFLKTMKHRHTEIPCASDALTIKYDQRYGRHVVAERDIDPGEVIAIEEPYSMLLTPKNMQTHCSNCMEVSWANVPCDYCTYAMYCSEECKALEWKKYHDIECAVFPLMLKLDFGKLNLFSLRLTIQAVRESQSIGELRELLNEVDSCTDPLRKGFSKDGIFESNHCRSILSLVTNREKRSGPDLFGRSMDSCFVLYFLATRTNMFGSPLDQDLSELIRNKDVTFIGGFILRQQQMIPSNCHSINEVHVTKSTTQEEANLEEPVERCVAAMSFLSLLNHSCNPNILRLSVPKHEIILALHPIKKGEQVLDSYGHTYWVTPKIDRQEELLRQYHFKCDCVGCREDWSTRFDIERIHSLCQVEDKYDKNFILTSIIRLEKLVSDAAGGSTSNKFAVLDIMWEMMGKLYPIAPMPCYEINVMIDTIQSVYRLCENRFDIPEL